MTVVELQDIANDVFVNHDHHGWHFSATVRATGSARIGYVGIASVTDPDFLVAATKLICEAKRMREAAR